MDDAGRFIVDTVTINLGGGDELDELIVIDTLTGDCYTAPANIAADELGAIIAERAEAEPGYLDV